MIWLRRGSWLFRYQSCCPYLRLAVLCHLSGTVAVPDSTMGRCTSDVSDWVHEGSCRRAGGRRVKALRTFYRYPEMKEESSLW